jgi:uncharacterized membrane protein YphA (DoxX/SURF4 family)
MNARAAIACGGRARLRPGVLLATLLAVVWLAFGLGKVLAVMHPADGVGAAETWAAQFPRWLVLCTALAEVGAGSLICFGQRRFGLVLGLVLLAIFSGALLVWPPGAAQACGCGGVLSTPDGHDLLHPSTRNFLLASLHAACLLLR